MPVNPQAQVWVGAPSKGGLALPDAHPTDATLYGPRGVYLDDQYLIVADTGNHRVLIWHTAPKSDHSKADIVLGQRDFETEGPNARGAGPQNGLNMPTGVSVVGGNLVVADAWNHRLLVWEGVPQSSFMPPSAVIGQADFASVNCNRGRDRGGTTFNWPFGFLISRDRWLIMDTGNRRVLGWHISPLDGRPADFVFGQPDLVSGDENRGASASASSFRWPHAAAEFDEILWIADAGNHRLLGWPLNASYDSPAARVLGQHDFVSNQEFVMARQSAETMRFPYGIASANGWMAVADTANNRVLGWSSSSQTLAADWVLGQPDFHSNGENHWKAVTHQTFCWPYGLCAHRNLLAVADSGNNRVMIWNVPTLGDKTENEKETALCV